MESQIRDELDIATSNNIYILTTIKAIQKRMKDPDLVYEPFPKVYNKLSFEFPTFFEKNGDIFTKVVRGESLATLACVVFYEDKVRRGIITQESVNKMIEERYIAENLRQSKSAATPTNTMQQTS